MSDPFVDFVDLVQAARWLRIHPQSLRRLIKEQRVSGFRMVYGKYVISQDDLRLLAKTYNPRPGRKGWGTSQKGG